MMFPKKSTIRRIVAVYFEELFLQLERSEAVLSKLFQKFINEPEIIIHKARVACNPKNKISKDPTK